MKAIVFLGGGRITTALVAGLRLSGYDKPIVVYDRNAHKLRTIRPAPTRRTSDIATSATTRTLRVRRPLA